MCELQRSDLAWHSNHYVLNSSIYSNDSNEGNYFKNEESCLTRVTLQPTYEPYRENPLTLSRRNSRYSRNTQDTTLGHDGVIIRLLLL